MEPEARGVLMGAAVPSATLIEVHLLVAPCKQPGRWPGSGAPRLILAHSARPDQSPLVWHPHPDVWALVALLALCYFLALTRLGPQLAPAGQPVATRRQVASFSAAVVALWVFSDWPIHDLSEGYLYSVHMIQHLVYTLVVPPLVIFGVPIWCWRWLLRPVLPVFRRLVNPVVALAAFSVATLLSHLPAFVTAAVESGPAHLGQHVAIVGTAFLAWWPLTSRVQAVPRINPLTHKMVYLFFFSLVSSIAGSFLVWAREPVYEIYARFPRLFGVDALEDQRVAGAIMEVGEGIVVFGLMLAILVRSWRQDEPSPTVDQSVRPGPPAPTTASATSTTSSEANRRPPIGAV